MKKLNRRFDKKSFSYVIAYEAEDGCQFSISEDIVNCANGTEPCTYRCFCASEFNNATRHDNHRSYQKYRALNGVCNEIYTPKNLKIKDLEELIETLRKELKELSVIIKSIKSERSAAYSLFDRSARDEGFTYEGMKALIAISAGEKTFQYFERQETLNEYEKQLKELTNE